MGAAARAPAAADVAGKNELSGSALAVSRMAVKLSRANCDTSPADAGASKMVQPVGAAMAPGGGGGTRKLLRAAWREVGPGKRLAGCRMPDARAQARRARGGQLGRAGVRHPRAPAGAKGTRARGCPRAGHAMLRGCPGYTGGPAREGTAQRAGGAVVRI